jgi:hypothetical protein
VVWAAIASSVPTYLELARSICPEFPSSESIETESPDFLWRDGILGVEVRRFFKQLHRQGFRRLRSRASTKRSYARLRSSTRTQEGCPPV